MSHHLPRWALEQGDSPPRPTTWQVIAAGLVLLVAAQLWPAASSEQPTATGPRPLSPACVELQRLARHGVHSGRTWRLTWRACEDPHAAVRQLRTR